MRRLVPLRAMLSIVIVVAGTFSRMVWAATDIWTSLGPEGGLINRLIPDFQNPGTVYAVSALGGSIFKTSDGAQDWRPANSGVTGLFVQGATLDARASNTLYVLTDGAGFPTYGDQLFRSTDGGISWHAISSAPAIGCCSGSLAIDPRTSDTLYLGTCLNGVFRSTDGGTTWAGGLPAAGGLDSPFAHSCVPVLLVDSQTPGTVYAATSVTGGPPSASNSVFKSTDGGKSWYEILAPGGVSFRILSIDPHNPALIYALAEGSDSTLFLSSDGGTTWAMSSLPAGFRPYQPFAFDPRDPNVIYAVTENGLFETTDGGATWELLNSGLTSADVSILAVGAEGAGNLYAGAAHNAGILKSSDSGMSWRTVNSGLRAVSIGSLGVSQSAATLYAAGDTFLWKSADAGASWTTLRKDVDNSYQPAMAIDPRTPRTLYVAGTTGILKSADGGTSWDTVRPDTLGVLGLTIDPQTPDTVYAALGETADGDCWYDITCRGLILKSVDAGETWVQSEVSGYYIGALAVDPLNPDTIYAGAFGENRRPAPPPHSATTPAVLKSRDGGANWTVVYSGETWAGWYLSVAIDPQNPRTLYAYTPGILKSTDGGTNWSALDTGIKTTVRAMLIDPQSPATLYAGTSTGVFRSIDGGASWTAVNAGLTSRGVVSLAFDPHDPATLYAGTLGGGVFRITFTKLGAVRAGNDGVLAGAGFTILPQ